MEKLDKVVLDLQNKAIVAIYKEKKLTNSSSEKARGYMGAIEIINREYKTNYESFGLEAIVDETNNIAAEVLKFPLMKQ